MLRVACAPYCHCFDCTPGFPAKVTRRRYENLVRTAKDREPIRQACRANKLALFAKRLAEPA